MSLEREVKLTVPAGFELPDLSGVMRGVSALDRGTHLLEATYWDTDKLELLQQGVGLRHRTRDGGEGTWTMKGRSSMKGPAVVREETEVLGEPGRPPRELLDRLAGIVSEARLRPVARLRTRRHQTDVVAERERRLAEVVDDLVSVVDPAGGVVSTFREVEIEEIGDPPAGLVEAVLSRLAEAGAGKPDPTPKYVRGLRALGYRVPSLRTG